MKNENLKKVIKGAIDKFDHRKNLKVENQTLVRAWYDLLNGILCIWGRIEIVVVMLTWYN